MVVVARVGVPVKGGQSRENRLVTFAEDWNQPDVPNPKRHPTVANLMAPLEQAGIDWSINKLCRAAKITNGVSALPFVPNRQACYRFILGKCKKRRPTGCEQVDRDELPDAVVIKLCNMLAPGVAALCAVGGTATPPPPKKKKKQG